MNTRVVIDDRMPQFKNKLYTRLGALVRSTSNDILEQSRDKAPYQMGHLRGNSYNYQLAVRLWRVTYNIEYAGAQEAGKAGNKVFRNYTTPGTGAHYLEKTGDRNFSKMRSKIKRIVR